ncbi:MAG TPA: helix-turn-helix transcriptional regulator [Chloroflexota bacterium]|jgi:transcriptional regulator with XRE-family HTH domain|nr:helix-turn-helix transcriptional regulator [Chloroflexota bacterium]
MTLVASERPPSPAAAILQLARLQTGMSQRELGRRAGVPASMISAYERDKRQPTLNTLLRLLKAAGLELRMHVEPYRAADDPSQSGYADNSGEELAAWERQLELWRGSASRG